jgi:hypothetical protein
MVRRRAFIRKATRIIRKVDNVMNFLPGKWSKLEKLLAISEDNR